MARISRHRVESRPGAYPRSSWSSEHAIHAPPVDAVFEMALTAWCTSQDWFVGPSGPSSEALRERLRRKCSDDSTPQCIA